MTKKLRKLFSRIKLVASMPSVWLAIIILLLAVVSIFVSKVLYENGKVFESSVFSNIFAGLSTGFIITILSNAKSLYVLYLQSKLKWFQQIRELIHTHFSKMHELNKAYANQREDFFDVAYDTSASASHVNAKILQSTFDKVKWFDPSKYFIKHFNYDPIKESVFFDDLRDYLIEFGEESNMQREVLSKVEEVSRIIQALNTNILNEMTILEIKIGNAQKSIV